MTPAAIARLRAELAEAQQRWDTLEYRWQRAKHTSSGGSDTPEDLDVELARAEASILELKERLAEGAAPAPPVSAVALPAPAQRAAVDLGATPANDASAPEYVGTKQAAALLGISPRTLEGLRARGAGPAHVRIGRVVRYRREDLRRPAK